MIEKVHCGYPCLNPSPLLLPLLLCHPLLSVCSQARVNRKVESNDGLVITCSDHQVKIKLERTRNIVIHPDWYFHDATDAIGPHAESSGSGSTCSDD